jgi:coenzyme F420-reducing hydrogenase gamma subunit
MKKLKIAIYDFTDCEGCEVKLCSIKEKLIDLVDRFDIVNWRLAQDSCKDGPYDAAIIEGTPITKSEVALLKELREKSRMIITLGACASIAGVPGIMEKKERKKWYDKIYGSDYKPRGIDALPVSAYIRVDHMIHGCPVDEDELVRTLEELASGKVPHYRGYSVCFECKQAGNPCRLLNKEICFGPITQGGCKAVCVSAGSPCYGCFGFREDGNIPALVRILRRFASPAEIRSHISMFFNQIPEYKAAFEKALKKRVT